MEIRSTGRGSRDVVGGGFSIGNYSLLVNANAKLYANVIDEMRRSKSLGNKAEAVAIEPARQ